MSVSSQSGAESGIFSSVEELEEANRSEGFGVVYRQLSPGPFVASLAAGQAGGVVAFREHFRNRVELSGDTVPGMITVGATSSETPAVLNGRQGTPDRLFIWTEGSEIDAAMQEDLVATSFIVPTAVFERTLARLYPDHRPLSRGQVLCLSPGEAFVRTLVTSVHQVALGEHSDHRRQELGQEILDAVASAVAARQDAEAAPRRSGSPGVHRTLHRAKRYLDTNLESSVSMSDLCRHCGVGVRMLQRHFVEGVGVSPSRYILARRLNRARRRLLREEYRPGVVSTAALGAGFNHLGRFSGVYRRYFGELPQETVARGNS